MRIAQDQATPAWSRLGADCHPNRDVAAAIDGAGFEMRDLRRQYAIPNIPPLSVSRPHIMGVVLAD